MNIHVVPERIVLGVMITKQTADIASGRQIAREQRIQLAKVKDAVSFAPYLTANFQLSGASARELKTVVKYEYWKDDRLIWHWHQAFTYSSYGKFQPTMYFDLVRFRAHRGNVMVGFWKVNAQVGFARITQLRNMPSRDDAASTFLESLRIGYQELASFEFEVFAPESLLTPTGDFRQPERVRLTNAVFSIDDI